MARTLAMFTDVSLCIGCRACQVACKQWNQLAPEEPEWTGTYQSGSSRSRTTRSASGGT
jgi:Fe-S-cluster-containing dehydrogenase component